MVRLLAATSILLLALGGVLLEAAAQGRGQSSGKGKGPQQKQSQAQGRTLGSEQGKIIRDWFADENNLEGLTPGLAKREQLPPGLQRQLQKNGTLPPGLQKRIQPLPGPLEGSLPKLPDGEERVIIGDNLVLIVRGSNKILDIIEDIF